MPTIIPTMVSPTVPPSSVPRWTISAESDPDIQTVKPTIMATYTPMRKYMIIAPTSTPLLLPPDDDAPMLTPVAPRKSDLSITRVRTRHCT